MSKLLQPNDYEVAAALLGVEIATLKAVAEVESRGSGFLPTGRPVILYEPHIFSRYTNHVYDKTHPKISYPKWKSGQYGPISAQWPKFQIAAELNPAAAVMACSWGKFQLMGFNYQKCGFEALADFRIAMDESEREQLIAFCNFVRARGLVDELQRHDWPGFAFGYNGAGYAANRYDEKLAAAYRKYAKLAA